MKSINLLFLITLVGVMFVSGDMKADNTLGDNSLTSSREFYQLKIYTLKTDEQEQVVDKYLKDAFLPGLKKLGIGKIGVFKPKQNETDSVKKIYVLIPFFSQEQLLNYEETLLKDKNYVAAGSDYLNASYDRAPYERIESIILKAFEDMPIMALATFDTPRSNRVYELRSYESSTESYFRNKVEMFNAGGEIILFDKLEFNAVFYGEVISGPKMPNLMYMTTFSDKESRDAHWDSFRKSPEWKKLKPLPKYQHNVSHIDILLLYPTEYSDY